jgi:hypothetical protein
VYEYSGELKETSTEPLNKEMSCMDLVGNKEKVRDRVMCASGT